MPIRLRRASRKLKAAAPEPAISPRLERAMGHLVATERARVLPTDDELDRMAEVRPADVDRAESLWDDAQRLAGTGLDGMLSAKTNETDA